MAVEAFSAADGVGIQHSSKVAAIKLVRWIELLVGYIIF